MNWQALVTTLGSVGIGVAALAWLVRALVQHWLSRGLDRFKEQLRSDHQHALEKLRADLQRVTFEHQTRFSQLHLKRAEVIAELYEKLIDAERLNRRLALTFSEVGTKEAAHDYFEASTATREFLNFYKRNEIYFDDTLCSKLGEFHGQLQGVLFTWLPYFGPFSEDTEPSKEFVDETSKIMDKAPQIRNQIKASFRDILGGVAREREL